MGANDKQVGGRHYKRTGAVEHWDLVAQWDLDYFQGQITKYVMRWREKGGLQDLEKAAHFLEKYREVEAGKALAASLEGLTESPHYHGFERVQIPEPTGPSEAISRRKVPSSRKK